MERPKILPLEDRNFEELMSQMEGYLDDLDKGDEVNEDNSCDYEYYIYEKCLEYFYGPKIHDYINEKLNW